MKTKLAGNTSDAETIEALRAKCAQLSASLEQAEAEGREGTRKTTMALEDCADLLTCYIRWHRALFQAIEHYTETEPHNIEPLDMMPRGTVAQLAGIGAHLAEQAYGEAFDYTRQAEEMRGAA